MALAASDSSSTARASIHDGERLLSAYFDAQDRNARVGPSDEAAGELRSLYGRKFIDESRCHAYNSAQNVIEVHPPGEGLSIKLTVAECNRLLQNARDCYQLAADAFIREDFGNTYQRMLSGSTDISYGERLYVYCVLGIGSISKMFEGSLAVSSTTKSLYNSSMSLVGFAMVEATFTCGAALAALGHFSMQMGEIESQGKFARAAFDIFCGLGYHRTSLHTQPSQARLAAFWHVYSVVYVYSIFFGSDMAVISIDKITAPFPSMDGDANMAYLFAKLDLIRTVNSTIIRTAKADAMVHIEVDNACNAIKEMVSTMERAVASHETGSFERLYGLIYKSMSFIGTVYIVRKARHPSKSNLSHIMANAESIIGDVWTLLFVHKSLYPGTVRYLCVYILFAALAIIYCQRAFGLSDYGSRSHTDMALGILDRLKQSVPQVQRSIDIIQQLHNDTLRQANATQDSASAIDSNCDYGMDLDNFLADNISTDIFVSELCGAGWLL